jgi:ubiquinone/menaquinone biosynthesis C-methylase UbiE
MKKEVFEHYQNLADRFMGLSNKYCDNRYLLEIKRYVRKSDSALDVGCGTGLLLSKLAAKRRVGVDLSSGLLRQLKKSGLDRKIELVQADAESLPFKTGSFEVVYSVNLLEHVPHPEKVVSEGMRVLKKRGKLVLITPNGDMGLFLEIADRLKLKAPEGPHHFLSSKRLARLVPKGKEKARVILQKKFVLIPKGPRLALDFFERLEPAIPLGFFHLAVLEKI